MTDFEVIIENQLLEGAAEHARTCVCVCVRDDGRLARVRVCARACVRACAWHGTGRFR